MDVFVNKALWKTTETEEEAEDLSQDITSLGIASEI
jgi:hypothetical protein